MGEDALCLLFAELEKGLEEPTRRPAAAAVLSQYCSSSKLDFQQHVPTLLTVNPVPFASLPATLTGLAFTDFALTSLAFTG